MQNMGKWNNMTTRKIFSFYCLTRKFNGERPESKILLKSSAVTVRETQVEGSSAGCWDNILQAPCGQGVPGGHATETQHWGSILVIFWYFFLY